jgi:hypothetical protein
LAPLVWLLGLGACTSILGIEDLHEGRRDGSSADGGDGNTGATSSTGGKNNVAGSNNNTEGGAPGPTTGGAANAGTGNDGNTGGQDTVGAGGAGGDGTGPVLSPVHGHVIDFWGKAIANLPVQIGDTLTSTDDKGAFTIENVPPEYDVSMVFDHASSFSGQSDAWVYLGLTRRDPTLQMFWGGDQSYGYAAYTFNPKPTLATGQTIWVGFGGTDGNYNHDNVYATGTTGSEVDWYGPTTTKMALHALLIQQDANKLPTGFLAYGTNNVSLSSTETSPNVVVPFAKMAIAAGTLTGTVKEAGANTRSNQVYLGFKDNARILLADDDSPKSVVDNFSYKVPTGIADGDITFAAIQGYQYSGFQVVHADGLKGDEQLKLEVPPLAVQLTPAAGAKNVDQTTKFSLKDPGGNPGPYVAMFYSQDPPDPNTTQAYQAIYIVTAKTQFTIPTILGGGFAMYPGNDYLWSIATFGPYESVDAMVSPDGFIDEFAWDETRAFGPHRVSGTFTDTDVRRFTTKP